MLVKTMTMGLQLFVPIAFIGLVVLCPVHANGGYLANDEAGNKVGWRCAECACTAGLSQWCFHLLW